MLGVHVPPLGRVRLRLDAAGLQFTVDNHHRVIIIITIITSRSSSSSSSELIKVCWTSITHRHTMAVSPRAAELE